MDKIITLREVGSVGDPKSFKATDLPSGGEPDNYIKSASVDNGALTLVKKDDTTVVFAPESGEPDHYVKHAQYANNVLTLTLKDDTAIVVEIPSALPELPEDASTKTYALQAVNGVLSWVEVTAE